jgi:hypothetical protein
MKGRLALLTQNVRKQTDSPRAEPGSPDYGRGAPFIRATGPAPLNGPRPTLSPP